LSRRGRGRGGRGKFQARTPYTGVPKENYKEMKKPINDWSYYLGSTKQASEFKATTEFLINYIKQNFKFGYNIAIAIINQKTITTKIWKPNMLFSRNVDPELKEIKNKQFKIEFKADYDCYCSREQIYNNNVTKAYALLWD
jgi:hypothetical protein